VPLGHMITIQIKKLNIKYFKKINVQKVYYTSIKNNISILDSLTCALTHDPIIKNICSIDCFTFLSSMSFVKNCNRRCITISKWVQILMLNFLLERLCNCKWLLCFKVNNTINFASCIWYMTKSKLKFFASNK
jgi:hypothetical protein